MRVGKVGRWRIQKKSQNSREKKIIAAVMVFPVDLGTQAVWTLAAPPATTCSSPPLPYTRVSNKKQNIFSNLETTENLKAERC